MKLKTLATQSWHQLKEHCQVVMQSQKEAQVSRQRVTKVSRTAVHNFGQRTADFRGASSLKAKKRGPRAGSRLSHIQAAATVRLMEQKCQS